jgi:hypothetical protein
LFVAIDKNPRRVVAAPSVASLQKGVPIADLLLPPRHMVMMIVGVALQGTCPTTGERLNLAINQSGLAMTRPATVDNTLTGWTLLEKGGESLYLFIPKDERISPAPAPVVHSH